MRNRVVSAWHWIRAMGMEGVLILFTLCLRPLGYWVFHRKSNGISSGRPILLVHGYCHDCSAWFYFRKKLAENGLGPIYVLNLKEPFRSISCYAEKVVEKAKQIEKETGREDLILVGHSMGGLVCLQYAVRHAPPGKVSDVVTIGTPLNGTRAAYFGLGANAKEMRYRSDFVQGLQADIENQPAIRFYHIGTKTDQLIIPSSSAFLGNRDERKLAVEGIGHLGLLFSSRVAHQVCNWVTESSPLPQQSKSVPRDRAS